LGTFSTSASIASLNCITAGSHFTWIGWQEKLNFPVMIIDFVNNKKWIIKGAPQPDRYNDLKKCQKVRNNYQSISRKSFFDW
jgi:hypothetical protein